MAQSKPANVSKKKTVSKTKTRFYVVKTAQNARTSLTGKWEDYHRKYIAQPLKTGKTIVKDLKVEPRETVVDLFEDGKARITDLNKDARARVNGYAKDGQAFLTKAGKNPRKTLDGLMNDGKELVKDLRTGTRDKLTDLVDELKIFMEGIEKDTRIVMADVIDGGRKSLDHMSGLQKIEKEISSRIESIPAAFNLPSRKEIERLARQVKNLNTKVNKLSKAQAV
jgi:polyhydroxyalkanoate synthesis regulator phasin